MRDGVYIIEEVRESRRRLSAECGHDPSRYVEYLKRFNRKYSVEVNRFRETRQACVAEDPPAE